MLKFPPLPPVSARPRGGTAPRATQLLMRRPLAAGQRSPRWCRVPAAARPPPGATRAGPGVTPLPPLHRCPPPPPPSRGAILVLPRPLAPGARCRPSPRQGRERSGAAGSGGGWGRAPPHPRMFAALASFSLSASPRLEKEGCAFCGSSLFDEQWSLESYFPLLPG